jgi:hypothetical protein
VVWPTSAAAAGSSLNQRLWQSVLFLRIVSVHTGASPPARCQKSGRAICISPQQQTGTTSFFYLRRAVIFEQFFFIHWELCEFWALFELRQEWILQSIGIKVGF